MASVDYYYGQSLAGIEKYGEEDFEWAVRLSSGALIKNWDKRRTAIPEIDPGLGFLVAVLDVDSTTLRFGAVDPANGNIIYGGDVVFTPTQYSITDPLYAVQEEFPQAQTTMVAEHPADAYPDELRAREAEGPENQEDEIVTEEVIENRSGTGDETDTGGSAEAN